MPLRQISRCSVQLWITETSFNHFAQPSNGPFNFQVDISCDPSSSTPKIANSPTEPGILIYEVCATGWDGDGMFADLLGLPPPVRCKLERRWHLPQLPIPTLAGAPASGLEPDAKASYVTSVAAAGAHNNAYAGHRQRRQQRLAVRL